MGCMEQHGAQARGDNEREAPAKEAVASSPRPETTASGVGRISQEALSERPQT